MRLSRRVASQLLMSSQAASIPEGQNELKRNQLRELAALNGTLRDDENQACQNCGEIGHRKYDCPQQRNYTANIICRVCGNAGHMAKDCTDRPRGGEWRNDRAAPAGKPQARIGGATGDSEFDNFMSELGGTGAPARIEAGPGGGAEGYSDDRDVKPWQRGPTGAPAPWTQGRSQDNYGGGRADNGQSGGYGGGGAAPWQQQSQQQSYGQGGGQGYGGGYGGGHNQGYGGGGGGGGYGQSQSYGGGGYGGYNNNPGYDQGSTGAAPPWQAAAGGYAGSPPPPPPGGEAPPPVSSRQCPLQGDHTD